MSERILVKNVKLYNNINATNSYDILISNGIISSINPTSEESISEDIFNGSGLIAIPGIIDMHIHGAGGSDSLDGTMDSFQNISRTLAMTGTTAFLSAMVINPKKINDHLIMAKQCTGKDLGGAELLGAYLEGPFINIEKRGGIVPESITEPSERVLDNILQEAGEAIKIMCVAPELNGIDIIIKRLRDNGIIASFGHSDASYEDTIRGFDMGINHVTHLFNAMRPLHHRDPGPLAAIFEEDKVSVELIGDSHHVHPSLIRMTGKLKHTSKIVCISDGISGMGLPDGIYTYNKRKYSSKNGLARYLDGTFIGSTMSLLNILMNFMDFTGKGFIEAIDSVTINPARILGIDNRKGSLDIGKDADLVLIDSDFNVHKTIISGRMVYSNDNDHPHI